MKLTNGLAVAVMASLAAPCLGHARWKCPPARDEFDLDGQHIAFENTGNKQGPCGPYSFKWGLNGHRTLRPGWQTLEWEESVSHHGAPFRLAILDANETARVILLDHIPHWDKAVAIPYVEHSYVKYRISVFIPDVKCDKCSLQLIYFMTDKTTMCFNGATCTYYPEDSACSGRTDPLLPTCFGAPNNKPCKNENSCYSNYHSCSDVRILGSVPLEEAKVEQPEDWPFRGLPGYKYGSEAGVWKGGWLTGVPDKYVTQAGDLTC